MFRFLALVWDNASPTQRIEADRLCRKICDSDKAWQLTAELPGVRVYCAGVRPGSSEVYLLHNGAGVVLGTVFKTATTNGRPPGKAQFGPAETATLVDSCGRELVYRYWGRYVAILHREVDRSTAVLKSPTGELDCLTFALNGVHLYFSNARYCPILPPKLSANWEYLAAEMSTLVQETRVTGLREIHRVLHGECVVHRPFGVDRYTYWHPLAFVSDEAIYDPRHAALLLRETTRTCIDAWASCYESVIALLSGGLDSSIVVSLLAKSSSKPRLTCLNHRNPYDSLSDERRYARLIAAQIRCELIEREQHADISLEGVLQLPRHIYPCFNFAGHADAAYRFALARSKNAGAYFLGHGGDQIFLQGAARYMCADFLHNHGLSRQLLPVAISAARMRKSAVWAVLKDGIRDFLRRDPRASAIGKYEFSPLLEPDLIETVRSQQLFIPEWLKNVDGVPPGKCWQIISLAVQEDLHSPWSREDDAEIVSPLLSQPLQELCLRIPSYIFAYQQRDRGLARAAFQKDLPPEISMRRGKGVISDYTKVLLVRNLPFFKELLFDGILVNQGIVNRRALEKALAGDFGSDVGTASCVMPLVGTEAWLRNWLGTENRLAA